MKKNQAPTTIPAETRQDVASWAACSQRETKRSPPIAHEAMRSHRLKTKPPAREARPSPTRYAAKMKRVQEAPQRMHVVSALPEVPHSQDTPIRRLSPHFVASGAPFLNASHCTPHHGIHCLPFMLRSLSRCVQITVIVFEVTFWHTQKVRTAMAQTTRAYGSKT